MMMEILVAAFVAIGAFFTLVGSIGLLRLPDFYSRLHGPTKATTLGVGGLQVASMIWFIGGRMGLAPKEFLIFVFLFMTAPISAHLMARAALHLGVRSVTRRPKTDHGYPLEKAAAE